MGRPREFDQDRVLDAAMRTFWSAGYAATSTEDLCTATGLGRSSVYNTFTSKRALFLASLRRYTEQKTAATEELLSGPRPVREKIGVVFFDAVDPDPDDPIGCLVVNSMVELAPVDAEVAELLGRDAERRAELLRTAFEVARRSGEIDAGSDPWALAQFVIATVSGLRVAARAGSDRSVLEAIAGTALAAL